MIADFKKLAAFRSPPYTLSAMLAEIKESLQQFHLQGKRPWLFGLHGPAQCMVP